MRTWLGLTFFVGGIIWFFGAATSQDATEAGLFLVLSIVWFLIGILAFPNRS